MDNEELKFVFNPFNIDIQYCLKNNIYYDEIIIIKYIAYCLLNYNMTKIKNIDDNGEETEYVWLDIDVLCEALMLLELSKISMIRKINNMCDEGKIIKLVKCDEGTRFKKTYYSLPIETINAINGVPVKKNINTNEYIVLANEKTYNEKTYNKKRNDIDNSIINLYKEIINYLNEKAKTSFRYSATETQRLINARLNNGFKLEDFKKVIDNKCNEWLGTEMEKFLRPQTLFGTKFESYLNQKNIGYKPLGNNEKYKNEEF